MTFAARRWSPSRRLQGRAGDGALSGRVAAPTLLALEMLLHEESERRALAGELEALREQWRQAEEIAAIADALLAPSHLGGRSSHTLPTTADRSPAEAAPRMYRQIPSAINDPTDR